MRKDWSSQTSYYISEIELKLKEMGVLETVDKNNLELLGDALEIYEMARRDVRVNGITVKEGPYTRQNPSLQIMRQQQAMILSFLKEFSVTCRGRRLLAQSDTADEETPLSKLIDMMEE